MIARFDHRPMLTAALALTTTVLLVVVVTLSTLLTTLPQAASPTSVNVVGNSTPGGGDSKHTAGEGGRGGPQGLGANVGISQPGTGNDPIDRHAEVVAAYNR